MVCHPNNANLFSYIEGTNRLMQNDFATNDSSSSKSDSTDKSEDSKTSTKGTVTCVNCQTTNTPLWRRSNSGEYLCNACGLYFKVHNAHRPLSLKTGIIKHRQRYKLKCGEYCLSPIKQIKKGMIDLMNENNQKVAVKMLEHGVSLFQRPVIPRESWRPTTEKTMNPLQKREMGGLSYTAPKLAPLPINRNLEKGGGIHWPFDLPKIVLTSKELQSGSNAKLSFVDEIYKPGDCVVFKVDPLSTTECYGMIRETVKQEGVFINQYRITWMQRKPSSYHQDENALTVNDFIWGPDEKISISARLIQRKISLYCPWMIQKQHCSTLPSVIAKNTDIEIAASALFDLIKGTD